jgi:hypothetical protein
LWDGSTARRPALCPRIAIQMGRGAGAPGHSTGQGPDASASDTDSGARSAEEQAEMARITAQANPSLSTPMVQPVAPSSLLSFPQRPKCCPIRAIWLTVRAI